MSHTKRSFIQHVIARLCPKREDRTRALEFAEDLWSWLVAEGYGPPEASKPRQSTDWYVKLSELDRSRFNLFWKAYGYKQDRNGAAMRWHQLGDLTEAEAQRIIEAAAAAHRWWRENAQPGQVRKMAQGWLHEKRWLDHEPEAKQGNGSHAPAWEPGAGKRPNGNSVDELRNLKRQLATVKNLHDLHPTEELQRQMNELIQRIGNFGRKPS